MYTVSFKMTDSATGVTVEARTRFPLPFWVRSRSQFVIGHFARIWCDEQARRYFGTDDAYATLSEVNGVSYAY